MNRTIVSFICTLAILPRDAAAQPAVYPVDAKYTATACAAKPSNDPVGDGKKSRDVVGSAAFPAMYVASDGTYAYFRLRLDADPVVSKGGSKPLAQFGWGVGLDTNGDGASMEYVIIANGIKEVVTLVRTSDGAPLRTYKPTLDSSKAGPAGQTFAPKYVEVEVTGDKSSLGGTADYFLTLAVPMADAASATKADPSPITWAAMRLWAGTSSNGTTLNADQM